MAAKNQIEQMLHEDELERNRQEISAAAKKRQAEKAVQVRMRTSGREQWGKLTLASKATTARRVKRRCARSSSVWRRVRLVHVTVRWTYGNREAT